MYISSLELHEFRSWSSVKLSLPAGPIALIGPNGQGKTNLVEAMDYLATMGSHRVFNDGPLLRLGADSAIIRAEVVRDQRTALLEMEINPGKSNRARVNRSPLPRARELIGLLRGVLFSPEDLRLVKNDPGDRRRFLDWLTILRAPRVAADRADYDRVLRQRNTLLKSARGARNAELSTLSVWDDQFARLGATIMAMRYRLLADLAPFLQTAYQTVASSADVDRRDVLAQYRPSFEINDADIESLSDPEFILGQFHQALADRRADELERGVSLIGPHRDEVSLQLGDLPAKGYASHGESWSLALSLKLAAFDLLRSDGDDPILFLDDVFAELDTNRRAALAGVVSGVEQVFITAAVDDDVPADLDAARFRVDKGQVHRE